jgi:hypothetical protein
LSRSEKGKITLGQIVQKWKGKITLGQIVQKLNIDNNFRTNCPEVERRPDICER